MDTSPQQTALLHRREFIARGLCCGAAGAMIGGLAPVSGWAAEGSKKTGRWTMRLSCSSINFKSLPIEQACERIAALGFEAVDIWSAHDGCPHLDDVLKRLGPAGLKELLRRFRLKLCGFSVYKGGYPRYAELLGKAGGGVAIRGSAGPCAANELTARMKIFLESLKPEIELAEKHDSYLAIENHGNALLHTLDSLKAFCDLNRHGRVGIALAPYHLQSIRAPVDEAITVAGRQLLFFYAWQSAPGTGQLPGIGPADCRPWIAALARAGYGRYVNPFMHHEPLPDAMSAAHVRSIEYLRKCEQESPQAL